MTTAADPTAVIASFLLDECGTLVGNRVFRPDLPESEADGSLMPRGVLVVRPAGGYAMFGGSNLPVGDPRVDVLCYGSTRLESDNIGREVLLSLRDLRPHVREGTLVRWARISGLVPLVDPITAWPYTVVAAQVMLTNRKAA